MQQKKLSSWLTCLAAVAALQLGGCASAPDFYLGNKVTDVEEHDEEYWIKVSFVKSRTRQIIRRHRAALPQGQGSPQFKSMRAYNLSQFYFVEPRTNHGQRTILPQFARIKLRQSMYVEGISARVYEFSAAGKIFHTVWPLPGRAVTNDEEHLRQLKEQRLRREVRRNQRSVSSVVKEPAIGDLPAQQPLVP